MPEMTPPLPQRPGTRPVHRVGIHLEIDGQKRTIEVKVLHGQTLVEALQQIKEIRMVQSKGFWYITSVGNLAAGRSLNVKLPYMEYDIDPALLNGEAGAGGEFWRLGKNGERIVPVTTIDGKVAYLTAQDIVITQDSDFEIGWNRGRFEYDKEAHPITSPEDRKKIWTPEDIISKRRKNPNYFMTGIEDLRSDYLIRDEILNPAKTQRMRYEVGKNSTDYRFNPLVLQPVILPGIILLDGLSPKLMQLARELEAKNKRVNETGNQSFVPINFGFSFQNSGFDAPQNGEGMGSGPGFGFDGPGGSGFGDAPSFGGSAGGRTGGDKTSKRPAPVHYARKEISVRKMVGRQETKTAQTSSIQNRISKTVVSAMQKAGERAQSVLQGMKTEMPAAGMPAGKHAEKEQATAAHNTAMHDENQIVKKQGQTQTTGSSGMTFHAPLSEGPLSFVQSIDESADQNSKNEMTSSRIKAQVSSEAGAAPNIAYQVGQMTEQDKSQNTILTPIPVLVAPAAQVVAAEPMKMAVVGAENNREKEKTGRKSAVVIVAAPVVAQKKKNAAIVPNKTMAVMENKKFGTGKKAA